VSAELIDARSNHNLWGDRYDRKLSDLVTVEQDITSAIEARLRERLSASATPAAPHGGTQDPEAYQLYLKGMYNWERRNQDSLGKARDFFNQAIAKDPNYAMAYVGLADYYYVVSDYAPISNSETMPKAKVAAEKALSLDDTLAQPHAILGGVHDAAFEWDASEREYRRAIELNPNDPLTYDWYSFLLSQQGRADEAIVQAKRAVELEPLNVKYNDTLAGIYRDARKYDLAIEQYKKTLDMDPNYVSALNNASITYEDMGQYELWLENWKKGAAVNDDREELAIADEAAQAYAKAGYPAAKRRIIELRLQLAKRRYVDPADLAYDYAAIGEKDQAFAWFDKAYAEKSDILIWIKVIPQMDPLRSDPRYAALLKKMGLPQ
jgi:tetratricopeptide (TPR) repeat protein